MLLQHRAASRAAATVVWLLFLLAVAGLSLTPAASSVHAAQLRIGDPFAKNDPTQLFFHPKCNATLKGEIFPGDADRIKMQVEAFHKRYDVWHGKGGKSSFLALCLSSPGGDLSEALKLQKVFELWMTVVDDGAECVSACAVVFMLSNRRHTIFSGGMQGIPWAGRYLHHNGKLGLHAPRLELPGPPEAKISKKEATDAYARALGTVRELLRPSGAGPNLSKPTFSLDDLRKDTVNFNFVGWGIDPLEDLPRDVIVAMLVTPPHEIYWISSVEEAYFWGIDIFGIMPPKRLTGSMLMLSCLNVTHSRCSRGALSGHGGFKRHCPEGFETHASRYYSSTDPDGARQLAEFVTGNYAPRRLSLWPKAGQKSDVQIQAFRVDAIEDKAIPRPCALRVTWKGDRIVDLDIQTFNGEETSWLGPQMNTTATDVIRAQELTGDASTHLRPWKMLPFGTKLPDLGKTPWGWLEDGADFFDRPTKW